MWKKKPLAISLSRRTSFARQSRSSRNVIQICRASRRKVDTTHSNLLVDSLRSTAGYTLKRSPVSWEAPARCGFLRCMRLHQGGRGRIRVPALNTFPPNGCGVLPQGGGIPCASHLHYFQVNWDDSCFLDATHDVKMFSPKSSLSGVSVHPPPTKIILFRFSWNKAGVRRQDS